jgi:hypothetical protein
MKSPAIILNTGTTLVLPPQVISRVTTSFFMAATLSTGKATAELTANQFFILDL